MESFCSLRKDEEDDQDEYEQEARRELERDFQAEEKRNSGKSRIKI